MYYTSYLTLDIPSERQCQYSLDQGSTLIFTLAYLSWISSTARPAKVDALKEVHKGKVEVVPIADLVVGDYTEALKGLFQSNVMRTSNNCSLSRRRCDNPHCVAIVWQR